MEDFITSSEELYPLIHPTLGGREKVTIPTVLGPGGELPKMGKPGDGAHDLAATISDDSTVAVEIPHLGFAVIDVAIATEIPEGYRGWITGRSGLSRKGILCATGLIDSGYRGTYGVVLYNFSGRPFFVARGNRIAQLSIEAYPEVRFVQVESLSPSERGTDGWGSTGLK